MKQATIANRIYIVSAIAISLFLLIAAIGKIVYPTPIWKDLDFSVGIFEIILAFSLVTFYLHWQIWVFAAIVFAVWGGYSLFWAIQGISCSCFGQMVSFPPGFSLLVDTVFTAYTLSLAYLLKAKRIRFFFLFSICMAAFGFLIARHLYISYF